jgi:NTP pyrophosphatase (non-canonical NTP hydrolase)
MDFSEYQGRAHATDEGRRLGLSVSGLVGEVGSVVSIYKKRLLYRRNYPNFKREMAEELGDTLWYLSSVASLAGLSLDEIAEANLKKASSLFDEGERHWFDRPYPDDEQFPRKFEVLFAEKDIGRSVLVKISVNGVTVGDQLTDNAYDPDGYRYHDAFHLAFVAVLSWSPVIRALLRRKRKSNPTTDEYEDGARAIAVEEALSIFVFNRAKKAEYFEDSTFIGFGLLQSVQALVGELEVKDCTAKQWKRAIFEGYRVFRMLRDRHGGLLSLDLDRSSIEYYPAAGPTGKQ